MQHLTTPRADHWADDQDPILTDCFGPLAAFDQPPGPYVQPTEPWPRANHIPRVAPQRPNLFRRLHTGAKRLYLEWLLYSLGQQVDKVEAELLATATLAHQAAARHRRSPQLNARRKDLRRHYATLASRMLTVRRELDSLQVAS